MSNKEDFESLQAKYANYSKEDIKEPALPVDIAIDEAMDLSVISDTDREPLGGSDLNLNWIDDLPIRAGGLRYAQTLWAQVQTDKSDAEEEWKTLSAEAFDLRDELLHYFRYAYRNNAKAIAVVNRIGEGYGNADMVQDLSDLALLGQENPNPLAAVHFDTSNLDRAGELANSCGLVLARVNGVKADNSKPAKEMRDRAYTYMKEAVDAIREAGRFVFWKDEERAKHYASAYSRQIRENNKTKEEA